MDSNVKTSENIVSEDEDFIVRLLNNNYHRNCDKYGRAILKSKENISKPKSKYSAVLKKKLKKYKLRKDGQEDSDVLDISQFLSTLLIINTGDGLNGNCDEESYDNWKVENYLTKMTKTSSLKITMSGQESEGCIKVSSKEEIKKQHLNIKNNTLAENSSAMVEERACKKDKLPDDSPPESGDINKPKELNAFQLMMNARNKSIGSNSPGKEKTLDINEEMSTKKHLKLKRTLALEKLALAKGSMKNREIEALRDENIKIKMSKRAKRLKNMINNSPEKGNLADKRNSIDFCKDSKHNSKSKNLHQHKRRRKSDCSEKATKRMKIESYEDNKIHIDDEDDDVILKDLQSSKNLEEYIKEKNKSVLTNATPEESTETCKKISKSDADFINKLSPSIKKKESMLSYYNKVDKNSESPVEEDFTQDSAIKIKFTTRRKKNDKSTTNNEAPVCNVTAEVKQISIKENFLKRINVSEIKKDKAEDITSNENKNKCIPEGMVNENVTSESSNSNICSTNDKVPKSKERRSKRLSKKPVKYQDHIDPNSDDDIFILTPEKPVRKTTPTSSLKLKKITTRKELSPEELPPSTSETRKKHDTKIIKMQPSKLAPIFAQKTQLSKAELEAKQRFLESGIPDELKKILEKQKSIYLENDNFAVVHHIQQKTSHSETFNPWTLKMQNLNLSEEIVFDDTVGNKNWVSNFKFEKFCNSERSKIPVDVKDRLEFIKTNYPQFPVYRTFRLLKNKCTSMPDEQPNSDLSVHEKCTEITQELFESKLDDPNETMWCDKFKPSCTNDIIGNFEGVKTLKKWLIDWKETNLDNKSQSLRHRSESSDSSDFYYPSDTDSRDSTKSYNNVLVINGPVGCGKTSTVYAIATELNIKVIEVNASSKRTGKIILSNLHEATQSHKVNRGTSSTDNSQNSQDLSGLHHKSKKNKYLETYSKKYIKPKKIEDSNEFFSQPNKNENMRTGMSLILVEDADLVFEQDDGFVSALNQIIQTSKRPVILVTSSITCHHLQRYVASCNVVHFHHLSPKMLGTWLDVMCLVENCDVWPNMGLNLLEYYAGDIRKAINILQFWIASENKNNNLIDSNVLPNSDSQDRVGVDDECSTTSWTDQDQKPNDDERSGSSNILEGNENMSLNTALFKLFVSAHDHDIGITSSVLQLPVNHLNIWWNIPRLFGFDKESAVESKSESNNKDCLKSLARLIDSISVSDIISAKMSPSVDTSVVSSPWKNKLSNGVSEADNLSSYSSGVWLADSMSYALLTSSINSTKRQFGMDDKEFCIDYTLPGMSQTRWRDRILSRHNGLYDGLSVSCRLDRRSLATDYLASCRDICRIEKDKSDKNTKRNNRFCHYLRSAKVSCSGDTLEALCESLNSVTNQC